MATTTAPKVNEVPLVVSWDDNNPDEFQDVNEIDENKFTSFQNSDVNLNQDDDPENDDPENDLEDDDKDDNKDDKDDNDDDDNSDDDKDKTKKPDVVKPQVKTNTSSSKTQYSLLTKELVGEGIFDKKILPKDGELNKRQFVDLFDKAVDERVNNTIKSMVSGLDDTGKEYLKFLKDGGTTQEFFELHAENDIPENIDLSDIENQKLIVRTYMTAQFGEDDLSDEEIEDSIQSLLDTKRLEKVATSNYKLLLAQSKQKKQEKIAQVKVKQDKKQQDAAKFATKVKDVASELEKYKGVSFSKDELDDLVDYVSTPRHRKQDKTVSGMIKELDNIFSDPKSILLLAKIIKNNFDGISSLKKEGKTEQSKSVRKSVNNFNEGGKSLRSSSGSGIKSLNDVADLLNID